jgi:hypothetical protein
MESAQDTVCPLRSVKLDIAPKLLNGFCGTVDGDWNIRDSKRSGCGSGPRCIRGKSSISGGRVHGFRLTVDCEQKILQTSQLDLPDFLLLFHSLDLRNDLISVLQSRELLEPFHDQSGTRAGQDIRGSCEVRDRRRMIGSRCGLGVNLFGVASEHLEQILFRFLEQQSSIEFVASEEMVNSFILEDPKDAKEKETDDQSFEENPKDRLERSESKDNRHGGDGHEGE